MNSLPDDVRQKIEESKKTAIFSILSNTLLAITKWVVGIFGNSYAIIADAIESTADVFSSILVLFANKYSYKPADANHPYGHGKLEALATFVVGGFLIGAAVIIFIHSIQDILNPSEDIPKVFTLYVMAFVILSKEFSYQYVSYKAKKIGSSLLAADAWHHRSDVITSVSAFIGISLCLFKGIKSADAWAAIFAGCFLLVSGIRIVIPAINEIMDKDTYDELEENLRTTALSINGVRAIDKCYIRKSGMFYYIDIHVVVSADLSIMEGHEICHSVKKAIMNENSMISNVMTHVEPFEESFSPSAEQIL